MSVAEIRAFLERNGLLANRNLGQNFLCDDGVAARLVELAGVGPNDVVVEIGTGLGILTRALAARASRVVTFEVDSGLVRALRQEARLPESVELRHEDALRADLLGLVKSVAGPVRLVANLPYSISGPMLRRILDLRGDLEDWSVMLQREVALRLLAAPGSRDYGSLTVLHALTVSVTKQMELSGGCFFPAPKVRSMFLRIRPLSEPRLEDAGDELAWLERVVRAAFSQRRKTLVNALRGGAPELLPDPERIMTGLEQRGLGR
ncbi:MAG: ribosomal RNA small subunit methyltransferase A, partial [Myxococcales bacterium]|nr:ribosomal RNA small subunit methyltransferase A [Myxococcales bacterium]